MAQRLTAAISALSSGTASAAEKDNGFVSGYRFSDTVSAQNQRPLQGLVIDLDFSSASSADEGDGGATPRVLQ
jgi:hypothetical protein